MLPSSGRTEFSLKESTINVSTLYILGPSDPRVGVGGGGALYQITDLINIAS